MCNRFRWSPAVVIASIALLCATVLPSSVAHARHNAPPDVQSAVDLAVDLATPLYGDGRRPDPRSIVNQDGVIRNDQEIAGDDYLAKRAEAIEAAKAAGNPYLPEQRRLRYAHCSQFMATVILNTIDPMYPGNLTKNQYPYMKNPNNGWQQVGTSETYRPADYRPGDIFLTRGAGHTFMWIGEHDGFPDVVAEASYAPQESPTLRLPSLKRYSVDQTTGLDSAGRAYDVWRFVGRTGEAVPPDPDDSWSYRTIFSDFEVSAINQPDPEGEPYLLGPGTSSVVVSFTLRTPNDAVPGDEFAIESGESFPFRSFGEFAIRAADGTEIATAEYVSRHAVRIVLSKAVSTRKNITGTVRLTTGASASGTDVRSRQRLMFYGGEEELGPGLLYNISKWSPPGTSLLGSAQIYDDRPGVLTYVVYRFDSERGFDSSEVVTSIRARNSGVALACGSPVQQRFEWLSSELATPIGSGAAVVEDCTDRDNSVTVRLPGGLKPPEGATGVRLKAAWLADDPAQSYRFSATLRAPGIAADDELTWTKVFRSGALDGVADGTVIESPPPQDFTAPPSTNAEGGETLSITARILVMMGAVVLAGLLFALGYGAGARRRRSEDPLSNARLKQQENLDDSVA